MALRLRKEEKCLILKHATLLLSLYKLFQYILELSSSLPKERKSNVGFFRLKRPEIQISF